VAVRHSVDTSQISLHKAKLASLLVAKLDTFPGKFFILCAAFGLHCFSYIVFWALVVVASVKINASMRLVSRDGECIDLVCFIV
jgi:hypothetical protein